MADDRDITEDEANLWDYATQDDKRWKEVKPGKEAPEEPEEEDIYSGTFQHEPVREEKSEVTREFPYINAGDIAGLDRSTAEKLRKGKLKIEARLDLHGLTQNEALNELSGFIPEAVAEGKRCLIIITGKGLKPDGSIGVLRSNMPHWLNLPQIRPFIIAFTHAQPKDGGEGALYVLVRRGKQGV